MVQRRGDKAQISVFKKLIGRVSKSVKIYYVPGNHDVGGSSESVSAYVREYGYDRFCFWGTTRKINGLRFQFPIQIA